MPVVLRIVLSMLVLLGPSPGAAEVLVRWDRRQIPSRETPGIDAVVVPAGETEAVTSALRGGYRVYLETTPRRWLVLRFLRARSPA